MNFYTLLIKPIKDKNEKTMEWRKSRFEEWDLNHQVDFGQIRVAANDPNTHSRATCSFFID